MDDNEQNFERIRIQPQQQRLLNRPRFKDLNTRTHLSRFLLQKTEPLWEVTVK